MLVWMWTSWTMMTSSSCRQVRIFTKIFFWIKSEITAHADLSLPLTRRFKHDPDTDVFIYDDLVANYPDQIRQNQNIFTFLAWQWPAPGVAGRAGGGAAAEECRWCRLPGALQGLGGLPRVEAVQRPWHLQPGAGGGGPGGGRGGEALYLNRDMLASCIFIDHWRGEGRQDGSFAKPW